MRYFYSGILGVTAFLLAGSVGILLGPDTPSRPWWLFNAITFSAAVPLQVINCAHAWGDHLGRHEKRSKS